MKQDAGRGGQIVKRRERAYAGRRNGVDADGAGTMERVCLIITYILAGVLGLCFGSFLNVLIYRLPRGMSLVKPPSHCISCGARVRWYDNVPVLSYLLLRGRCRDCGTRISPRYPLVELANCLLWLASVACFYRYGIGMVVISCIAISALIVVFACDLDTMTIPDSTHVVLLLCGLAALLCDVFGVGVGIGWQARLIGMAAGLGFFLLLYWGFRLLTGREGLGLGDVKLMTAAGLLVGWQGLIVAVLFGSVAAALVMGCMAIFRRKRGGVPQEEEPDTDQKGGKDAEREDEDVPAKAFPFAPFLAAATALALFFGQEIVAWYLGLFI